MYENRYQPPLTRGQFLFRMSRHALAAAALLAASLAVGMAGYMGFERLAWQDAFLNCAMLLGGMGPVDAPHTEAGKLFAGSYALYAGLVFLVSASVVFAPVVHRIVHQLHRAELRQSQMKTTKEA